MFSGKLFSRDSPCANVKKNEKHSAKQNSNDSAKINENYSANKNTTDLSFKHECGAAKQKVMKTDAALKQAHDIAVKKHISDLAKNKVRKTNTCSSECAPIYTKLDQRPDILAKINEQKAKTCTPECTPVHKFGPLKIVVVEGTEEVIRYKQWGAAVIAFAYMFIGVNVMTVLFYSLDWKLGFVNNLHIFICTVGFQLFMPTGILMFNELNGPSIPLKEYEKRYEHLFLQCNGCFCGLMGSLLITLTGETNETKDSLHCYVGIATCFLALLTLVAPLMNYYNWDSRTSDFFQCFRTNHPYFGVFTYISSSICFILGIVKKHFLAWLPMFMWPDVIFIMILFCVIYTSIVVYFPLKNRMAKPKTIPK